MGYIEDLRKLIGHKCINLNGSCVIIKNKEGHILMQQRKYPYGKWGLPGGLMDLGESTEDTARREVLEETGLIIGNLELIGVYSGEEYYCCAENGDEFYVVTTAYLTEDFKGTVTVNDNESIKFERIDPYKLPSDIAKTHKYIISDYLESFCNINY